LLRKGQFLYIPSVTDPLGGRLPESIGFKSVYSGVYAIGGIAFFRTDFDGAVLGVFAIVGASVAETTVLGWRLHCQVQQFEPLFPTAS
jgi:hypothetical protein